MCRSVRTHDALCVALTRTKPNWHGDSRGYPLLVRVSTTRHHNSTSPLIACEVWPSLACIMCQRLSVYLRRLVSGFYWLADDATRITVSPLIRVLHGWPTPQGFRGHGLGLGRSVSGTLVFWDSGMQSRTLGFKPVNGRFPVWGGMRFLLAVTLWISSTFTWCPTGRKKTMNFLRVRGPEERL